MTIEEAEAAREELAAKIRGAVGPPIETPNGRVLLAVEDGLYDVEEVAAWLDARQASSPDAEPRDDFFAAVREVNDGVALRAAYAAEQLAASTNPWDGVRIEVVLPADRWGPEPQPSTIREEESLYLYRDSLTEALEKLFPGCLVELRPGPLESVNVSGDDLLDSEAEAAEDAVREII